MDISKEVILLAKQGRVDSSDADRQRDLLKTNISSKRQQSVMEAVKSTLEAVAEQSEVQGPIIQDSKRKKALAVTEVVRSH